MFWSAVDLVSGHIHETELDAIKMSCVPFPLPKFHAAGVDNVWVQGQHDCWYGDLSSVSGSTIILIHLRGTTIGWKSGGQQEPSSYYWLLHWDGASLRWCIDYPEVPNLDIHQNILQPFPWQPSGIRELWCCERCWTFILLPTMNSIRCFQALCSITGSGRRTTSNLKPTGQSSIGILRRDSKIYLSQVSIKAGTVSINLSRSKWPNGYFLVLWSNPCFSLVFRWLATHGSSQSWINGSSTATRPLDMTPKGFFLIKFLKLSFETSPKNLTQWISR